MKKFNDFLNENAQMDDNLSDNLFVTFELTFKGETYYIIAQAKNTNLQATFNEKGEKIDNFTTEFTIGEEGVEIIPLKSPPQQVLDTLEKLGALKNMEIGDATSIISGLERDETLEPKVKKYIDMGQNELNYQLNIAIDNEDWKTAKEISSYLREPSSNESLTDKMTGKSDEEIVNKLKELKASQRLMKIHRYNLSDEYLPTDEEWEEEMKDFVPQEKLDFIKRFDLDDKFKPSDKEIIEDLKNLDGLKQLNYIRHFNLSKDLIPDQDKIKKDVVKTILKTYNIVNTDDKIKNIVDTLFDNGYVFIGLNIEDDNREREEKKKGYDVIWFKYDNPEHFISITDKSNLSEVEDRINLYKKRYNL